MTPEPGGQPPLLPNPREVLAPNRLPAPVVIRSDTVGIFAVLFISGVSQLLFTEPGSIRMAVSPFIGTLWSLTLAVFGGLGLLSCFAPPRMRLQALGLELVCRVALAFGAATYAVALIAAPGGGGLKGRVLTVTTYTGIAVLCAWGAVSIALWLRAQQRAVDQVLEQQDAARDGRG